MLPSQQTRDRPSLDVVLVTLVGGPALVRCLASLGQAPVECLVIGPYADSGGRTGYGALKWIASTEPVPMLRAYGVAQAQGDWVLVIEDSCELESRWYETFLDAARAPGAVALGGSVSIDPKLSARCLALACVEYAEFAPHRLPSAAAARNDGEVERIAGLCVFYRKSALSSLELAEGLVETEIFSSLRQAGGRLLHHPGLAVRYGAEDPTAATFGSRFNHGRIYGGGLRNRTAGMGRLLALFKCIALPWVLFLRAMPGLPASANARVRASAWMLGFTCAWSVGEFTGLLIGRGAALEAWRQ